ncbi:MAG: PilX N-terminal domain-containing pilus assembly protein [Acidiferrobacterales bacterium]
MNNANKRYGAAGNQQGVALIMAMVILVILTMLGISAIKSSSLQLKMATGLQDATMVFQAADSGLANALGVSGGLDLNGSTSVPYSPKPGINVSVDTEFTSYSAPPRGSGYSAVDYQTANFEQTATATIPSSGAKTVIRQGVAKLLRK